MIPHIITTNSISLFLEGRLHTIPSTHPNFDKIKDGLAADATSDELLELTNIPVAVQRFTNDRVLAKDGVLYYNDQPIDNDLSRKVLEFVASDQPNLAEPLVNFLDKLAENPSYRAKNGLYEWVARAGLPITPDGYLLAWKAVDENLMDYHSGTNHHAIGATITQPRNECDEDPDRTCSAGLHFCAASYLTEYIHREGCRVVVLKIHPKNVVAIPRDYDCAKGRACAYEVIAECSPEDVAGFFGTSLVADPTATQLKVGDVWGDEDNQYWKIIRYDGSDDTYKAEEVNRETVRWFHPDGRPVALFSGYVPLVRKVF